MQSLSGKCSGAIFQERVNQGPPTLLTDETTDISVTKLLTFSVRYYSPKYQKILETHLDLKEMVRATADLLMAATGKFCLKI